MEPEECENCDGTGWVYDDPDDGKTMTCPDCYGEGFFTDDTMPEEQREET